MVEQLIDTTQKKQIFLSNDVNDEPDYGDTTIEERTNYLHRPDDMSPEDTLVWRILCAALPWLHHFGTSEDEIVDHISIFEFTTNYKRYSKSFQRFRITAGEFFDCLHQTNSKNEVTATTPVVFSQTE